MGTPVNGNDINRVINMFQSVNKPLNSIITNNLATLSKQDYNDLIFKLGCCKENVAKMYVQVTRYFLKSLTWLPSISEFVIFSTFIALMFIIYEIYHQNKIDNRIRKNSRCALRTDEDKNKITAYDDNSNALFTVQYNTDKREYSVQCVNDNSGNNVNTYDNIKVYDFAQSTKDRPVTTNASVVCNQNFQYNSSQNKFYIGDPALVRFQTTGDASYFTG